MKKYIAFLLCLILLFALLSCNAESGSNTESTTDTSTNIPTDDITDAPTSSNKDAQNELARQAYGRAIRNEIKIYYPEPPFEAYFEKVCNTEKGDPSRQALIDMDGDGIEELILPYDSFVIILHFENDAVQAAVFESEAMETVYTDGSFFWSNNDGLFGYECGIGRLSFSNGITRSEELCRAESNSKFFIGGTKVTKEQYDEYFDKSARVPIEFTSLDASLFYSTDEIKAIELACAHWGIKDGDVDAERGFRYRVVSKGKSYGGQYTVSLYRFVYNSYYEHIEIATVNLETGEVFITPFPDAKG
jgi:hypothetical protein